MNVRRSIAVVASRAGEIVPALLRDAIGLSGFGLAVYGIWLVYAPAAFIFAGAMLLLGALIGARR